ncbi:MAG: insulinase family protein [Bacteroidales bacterium]|nr:insulinase family protein [Bacteroidales bacterium]
MNFIKNLMLTVVALLVATYATAQSGLPSDVPLDPAIRYGKLENGLTYYIMKNSLPENRGEFYIVVNAGAVNETPGQNGLAHFTEHMCFNGTKNFEKKDIINYLQSIGMKFGPEINAYTATDRTVYTLTKVPLENKANIDTALMILYDWGCNVSMEGEEIDAERGVIREEFRTRMSGMARAQMEIQKTLYKGSKYEVHNVIGELDVINNAPWDTLRAFYNNWYRPDLEAVIVIGDFDVDEMESKVKTMFSKMPVKDNPKPRNYYEVPEHKEPRVVISRDPEAMYNVIQIMIKHPADWNRNKDYYRSQYVSQLYAVMINSRMSEISQQADPPFSYAGSMYTGMQPKLEAYISFAVAGNDKIKESVKILLTENERALRHGFVVTELERAKKEMMTQVEKAYKERNKKKSDEIANSLIEHYLGSEPMPSDEFDYNFAKEIMDGITIDEINKLAKKWITDENMVVAMMGLESESVAYPTEAEVIAMIQSVKSEKIDPYEDKVANRPLIAAEPAAGTIVKETKDEKKGTTTWELSNGVKVVVKSTDYKDDEILMGARSLGGYSVYSEKDDISARIAADVVEMSGISDFDNIELQKQLAGKNVSVYPNISELYEGFSGRSTKEDFVTLLQLTYLYFTAPRVDNDAFASYVKREKAMMQNKAADPSAVFGDSINNLLNNHHPRFKPMTPESYDLAKTSRIKYIFSDRFGDPSGFTFYFVGNIDQEQMKKDILTYLGGLPTINRTETYTDLGKRIPQSNEKTAFTKEMKTPKATVFIAFPGQNKYKPEERLLLDAVAEYLDVRMIETLREDQGGTYGASVFSNVVHYPEIAHFVGVYFDTDPEKLDTMVAIVYDELKKLQANGPDEKTIHNIVENKLKEHKEKVKENRYWLSMLMNDDYNKENYIGFDYEKFWTELNTKQVQKAAKKYLDANRSLQLIMSSTDVSKFNK